MASRPENYYVPYVLEQSGGMQHSYDLWSRLLKDRIIFIGDAIDDHVANIVIAQMLFLVKESPDKDIELYINSPGGSVTDGLAIYDTMQMIKCDVATTCVGQAASMGAVLLAAGTPGKRLCLEHSRVMIHQVSAGFQGTAMDIDIQAQEILRTNRILHDIIAYHTGHPVEEVLQATSRDNFMTATEAKDFGIVDVVLGKQSRSDLK